MYAEVMLRALTSADNARPRTQQAEIGVSAIGGCSAKAWHTINGTPPTNPSTLRLPSIMGTLLHTGIEQSFKMDPWWEDRYELEVAVELNGLPGHVDCYDKQALAIIDWKSTTLKNASYFPSRQQKWQVQVYGMLCEASGRPVETVHLVCVFRDGTELDVLEWSAPYDREEAEKALAWLEEVESQGEPPAPERDAVSFCKPYCEFFGTCPGKLAVAPDSEPDILFDEDVAAVRDYIAARDEVDAAQKRMAAAREALTGVSGHTAQGDLVVWSERTSSSIDRDAIKAVMGEVPMKQGKASLVLNVKGAS